MRKSLTEIVFILDRSGSMSGLEADTIGGFNSMIEKQKKEAGEALISVVLFDSQSDVLYDRVNVQQITPMTDKDYTPCGCTALVDAIGGAIHQKYSQICPPGGRAGAYAVRHHDRWDGERQPPLQQRSGKTHDRA